MKESKRTVLEDTMPIGCRIHEDLYQLMEKEREKEGRTRRSIIERALTQYYKVTNKK